MATFELRSLVSADGTLELSLLEFARPEPAADEVVVEIRAAPINPSDVGLLLAGADLATATPVGTADRPRTVARVPAGRMAALAGRVDQSLPVGNEGAGIVVAAGSSQAAQALAGKTVALFGGGTYAHYRKVKAAGCLPLPEGATAADGASSFVNPLTALGMVDTMRAEGHTALVHTAAASNLGQMLNRICLRDGVPLVNIVRKPAQVELLRGLGAAYVCDSTAATFKQDLFDALAATGATLAFDAIGGGTLVSTILATMEAAITARSTGSYSRYGSSVHKQVYIYGGLDPAPTELERSFGLAWGAGGWLLWPFLLKAGPERVAALKACVAAELTTTFASRYERTLTLAEVLEPANMALYAKPATGNKFLVDPSR